MKLIKETVSPKGALKLVRFRNGKAQYKYLPVRNQVFQLTPAEGEAFKRRAKALAKGIGRKVRRKRKAA